MAPTSAFIDPIAFEIGPIPVYWYGLILSTAVLAALWLSWREARSLGINADFIIEASIWIVPAAIIFARLYEVFVLSWSYYSSHPWEIPAIRLGGLAIHGGVLGGVLIGYIYARLRRADFWQWADIIAPALILAQAIGRWGNFVNQEAYGSPAPDWVVRLLPSFIRDQMWINGAYAHPTFLYESLWNLAVFGVLEAWRRRNPVRGVLIFAYFVLYNLGRLLIESIRMDSSFTASGFKVAQVAALGLIIVGLAGIWWRQRTTTARYRDLPQE
jgi:phosphatidylglycerol:prolipoprotein diacylglycerol transferase